MAPRHAFCGSRYPLCSLCQPRATSPSPKAPTTVLSIFHSIRTWMDYKGQKLAQHIFQGLILFCAVIGFIAGYIIGQLGWTFGMVMAGFTASCLLTLPPWPMYRRNPLKWLPVRGSGTEEKKTAGRKTKRHTRG